jgi:hypothetical protein
MKNVLVFLMALVILATSCVAFAEEPNAEAVPLYPCMVTGNKVRERTEPNTDCEVVCLHKKGDIVNVIDPNPEAEWWQLDNGHYMSAKYLELMCSNDSPYATDVEVIDEVSDELENMSRLLKFMNADIHAKKEDVVAVTHNCILLITQERCMEFYRDDQLYLRIDLVADLTSMKFTVKEVGGATYDVKYISDIANRIMNNSTDYTYFVVLD